MSTQMKGTNIAAWLSMSIAAVALVLSQLPPLPSYFNSPQLSVEVGTQLNIEHYLGHMILQPSYVQIENSGGAPGTVSSIKAQLAIDDRTWSLWGQYYQDLPFTMSFGQHVTPAPFASFDVPPNVTRKKYVRFFSRLKDKEIAMIHNTREQALKEISTRWNEVMENSPTGIVRPLQISEMKISDKLFKSIETRANQRLALLESGNYELRVSVQDASEVVLANSCYTFSLKNDHMQKLKEITERYKDGQGFGVPFMPQFGGGPLGLQPVIQVNLEPKEDCPVP